MAVKSFSSQPTLSHDAYAFHSKQVFLGEIPVSVVKKKFSLSCYT
jgi:hypothetical protein